MSELPDGLDRHLADYVRALRACLSALDGGAPEDAAVSVAFAAAGARFDALGDLTAARAALLGEAQRARFDERVEEAVRLHAVVTATLSRERERLLGLIAGARVAHRACRDARQPDPTGRTCDMRA